MKLIVLMRDPRAVRSSRNKIGWCNFAACNSAEVLCNHYEMDLGDAVSLSSSHPDNVLIVKYEELVTRPLDVIPIILKVSISIKISKTRITTRMSSSEPVLGLISQSY